MKKSFLFLLISIMTVFLIAGCADDTTKGGSDSSNSGQPIDIVIPEGTPTFIDLTSMDKYATLQGTYEITFFYTDGGGFVVLTNDCVNAETYGGSKACLNPTNEQVEMKGYGTISIDAQAQTGQIITKIQMTNNYMLTFPEMGGVKLSDQQYNYTKFTSIPFAAISDAGINTGNTVKGTTGRNLTKNVTAAESTYSFTVDTDKLTIINTMVDRSSLLPANVTVRMKKISDEVVDLKVNNPLTTPAITGFVTNPQ